MTPVAPFRRVYGLLSPRLRSRLWVLGALVLLSGFFEIAGVASIMPFMGMIVDPRLALENRWIALLHQEIPLPPTSLIPEKVSEATWKRREFSRETSWPVRTRVRRTRR